MADALVSTVADRLESIIQGELDLLVNVSSELKKLLDTFTTIQAVLQDAEKKQLHDSMENDWLHKLKDAAHCIEDILDKWTTEGEGSQVSSDGRLHRRWWKVFPNLIPSCFQISHLLLRHNIGCSIREIRDQLDHIAVEKKKYRLNELMEAQHEELPSTSTLCFEREIFGRKEDGDKVIDYLISPSGHDFATIAIVGMEGIGKTTLAGVVYDDQRVETHFDKKIWVSVSSYFNVRLLAENIIAASGETYSGPSRPLHNLRNVLRDKKFLLVLDNVWNEDNARWDQLKASLEGGAPGSRVVVTTRSERAAIITSTDRPYNLKGLSDEECWLIFRSKAFHGRNEEECNKLEGIGREIVKKCRGIPLAAVGIGNAMVFKKTEQDWRSVLNGEILDVPQIATASISSYDNLPSHLKRCFSYFSLFPKGHTLSRDALIKLWMAQNFISCESGREEEDIGRDYFDELLGRSLFRDIQRDADGHVIECMMHDLSHVLAQSVSKGECFTTEIERFNSGLFRGRHLSLIVNNDNLMAPTPVRFSKPEIVRTLLVFSQAVVEGEAQLCGLFDPLIHLRVEAQLCGLIDPLIHLRALDLSGSSIKEVPSSIGKLKLLRYLNLSGSCIEEVPEFVTRLHRLQTLKLNECLTLRKLPKGIGKMVGLRHLEIEKTDELVHLPNGIGWLSSLRTLSKFMVCETGKGCEIGELKNLKLLRGSLEMRNLKNLVSQDDAVSAELKNKEFLSRLLLDFESNARENDGKMLENGEMKRIESVLTGLGPPHANLKELNVWNYTGSFLPSWMEDSSSNLVQLNLQSCGKFMQLPALGKLPSLKFLKIQGNDEMEGVGHEFYGDGSIAFPSLEKLSFISLTNWKEWRLTVEDGIMKTFMPSLQELCIQDCPKLERFLGCLPDSLKSLEIKDCKQLFWMPYPLPLHLDNLWLHGDVGILSMPLQSIPSLKNLRITNSPNRFSLDGIENLAALKTLEIIECSELMSLTDRIIQLRALQMLRIYQCKKLTALPAWVVQQPLPTISRHTLLPDGVGQLPPPSISMCNQLMLRSSRVNQLTVLEACSSSKEPRAKQVCSAVLILTILFSVSFYLFFLRYIQ